MKHHLPFRPCLALPALIAGLILSGQAAAQVLQLDLPAGPLEKSLADLARQAGVEILYSSEQAAGHTAPAVSGTFSADEALRQLLRDSNLQVRVQDGSLIVVPQRSSDDQAKGAATLDLGSTLVIADRRSSELISAARQTTVIERDELERLRQGSTSVAATLSKAVPGMADSSRTITDFGQTLRGRNMLVLVDGIPLNTNRSSSRDLANLELLDIEQLAVERGSSAIYGGGASGGIVSVSTVAAGGENRAQTSLGIESSLSQLDNDGLGGTLRHSFSGSQENLDYGFALATRYSGASYDADGQRIAPEPSQGDLFDSAAYSLGGKLGLHLDDFQYLQLSASRYDVQQDSDYAPDPSVKTQPLRSVPARAQSGLQLEEQTRLTNDLLSLDYRHEDLLGSELAAQLYYRDYFTRFSPFDARAIATRGKQVDQITQESSVKGGRLTLTTPLLENRTQLLWGMDYNQERSKMPLDVFDPAVYDASGGLVFEKTGELTYMPWVTTRSAGVFAQLQHRFNAHWSAEGGIRHERASAEFDDFQPLSQLQLANPATVRGGEVDYSASLYNIGIVYAPNLQHELYVSFSQGFELPDIGLQVRNARANFDIGSSDLKPVEVDNYEVGWRGQFEQSSASLALFQSRSRLGGVQSFNNGLILSRTRERIEGVEAQLDFSSLDERWGSGGSLTWMQGRERPKGGDDQDMTGYRIPPLKLTAYLEHAPQESWSNRLQATYFGNRDYRLDDREGFGRREVDSYLVVDLLSQYRLDDHNSVTVGVQNLFNRRYYPTYSQLLRSSDNTSHLPAAGTVLSMRYDHRW